MAEILLQVGVKILLENKQGKYLLVRRSAKKYPEAGTRWDIVGGRIMPGEPLLESLRREIKEETQLDYVGEPKLIAAQDILRVPGKHVVRLTYIGKAGGEVKLDEENDMFQWVTRKEMDTIEPMDIYVKELLERGLL